MLTFRKLGWAELVAGTRVLLAAGGIFAAYHYLDAPPAWLAVLGGFLIYALILAVRGFGQRGALGLLALFVDTVYLMALMGYSGGRLAWAPFIFLLFLLTEALAFHGPVEVALVSVATGALCAVAPNPPYGPGEQTVALAGILACAFALHKRRQAAALEHLREELKESHKASDKARELERQRIASDFHDGPLQSFISLQMRLEIVRKLLERDSNAGMEDLKQLQSLAQGQVRDLRAFLNSMRPLDVDGANFAATARRTAEAFQKESGIPVAVVGADTPFGLPRETSLEVIQMLREALHNVQKHAGATRVAVGLKKTDRDLELSVDDNGCGFNFSGAYSLEELELLRLGPASLKRRARSLNADMMLESRPGRGVGMKFSIHLQ